MALNEKDVTDQEVSSPTHSAEFSGRDGTPPRPRGFIYKTVRIGPYQTWYASPAVQLVLVALVCFLCPGMFNALGGMGGTGLSIAQASDEANTALYATFAVVGFAAGTFTNRLGINLALSFGGLGYCIYVSSFLCFKHTSNWGFSIFAGALLGVCAGLLWSAQGAIMMSYPTERMKGRYISWFWMIFNLGGVIGSLVCRPISDCLISFANLRSRFLLARTFTPQVTALSPMEPMSASSFSPLSVPFSPSPSWTVRRSSVMTDRMLSL